MVAETGSIKALKLVPIQEILTAVKLDQYMVGATALEMVFSTVVWRVDEKVV